MATCVTSFLFGHPIYYWVDGDRVWRYEDNGQPIDNSPPYKCPKCNQFPTEDGQDPCIANLPGVKAACCGHGIEPGYVFFETGQVIRGNFEKVINKDHETK